MTEQDAVNDLAPLFLNEGFSLDHDGNMVSTMHVDFRMPDERSPIGAVVKYGQATTNFGRMQTALMWSRCNNRPVWAVLSPHTTGRFLLTIIATASRTGAFDYGHAPRIR